MVSVSAELGREAVVRRAAVATVEEDWDRAEEERRQPGPADDLLARRAAAQVLVGRPTAAERLGMVDRQQLVARMFGGLDGMAWRMAVLAEAEEEPIRTEMGRQHSAHGAAADSAAAEAQEAAGRVYTGLIVLPAAAVEEALMGCV